MTDGTSPVGDMNRNIIRGSLALRAIARLTIHCGAGTIEDDFEAKVGVHDATIRPGESCEDALALAAQVLDCFEKVTVPDQVSRI